MSGKIGVAHWINMWKMENTDASLKRWCVRESRGTGDGLRRSQLSRGRCGISRTVATAAVGPSETIGRGAERLQLKRRRLGNCFSGREIARGRWGCGHQGWVGDWRRWRRRPMLCWMAQLLARVASPAADNGDIGETPAAPCRWVSCCFSWNSLPACLSRQGASLSSEDEDEVEMVLVLLEGNRGSESAVVLTVASNLTGGGAGMVSSDIVR